MSDRRSIQSFSFAGQYSPCPQATIVITRPAVQAHLPIAESGTVGDGVDTPDLAPRNLALGTDVAHLARLGVPSRMPSDTATGPAWTCSPLWARACGSRRAARSRCRSAASHRRRASRAGARSAPGPGRCPPGAWSNEAIAPPRVARIGESTPKHSMQSDDLTERGDGLETEGGQVSPPPFPGSMAADGAFAGGGDTPGRAADRARPPDHRR